MDSAAHKKKEQKKKRDGRDSGRRMPRRPLPRPGRSSLQGASEGRESHQPPTSKSSRRGKLLSQEWAHADPEVRGVASSSSSETEFSINLFTSGPLDSHHADSSHSNYLLSLLRAYKGRQQRAECAALSCGVNGVQDLH